MWTSFRSVRPPFQLVCSSLSLSVVLIAALLLHPQGALAQASTTTISGTVYMPNGTDVLPNVLVYVTTGSVTIPASGATCPGTAAQGCITASSSLPTVVTSGAGVYAYTYTAVDGTFTLSNVPVSTSYTLVIQAGKWISEFTEDVGTTAITGIDLPMPSVHNASYMNAVPTVTTTLAAALAVTPVQGNIPLIAIASGSADAVECVFRQSNYGLGLSDCELTDDAGSVPTGAGLLKSCTGATGGRIHLYYGNGAEIGSSTAAESTLVTQAKLDGYDMVMFPCQSSGTTGPSATTIPYLINYASDGGRVFATHNSDAWLDTADIGSGSASFSGAATWDTSLANPDATSGTLGSSGSGYGIGTVSTVFTAGSTLGTWLFNSGYSGTENTVYPATPETNTSTLGEIEISTLRNDVETAIAPTQTWLTLNQETGSNYTGTPIMQMSFNTPVGAVADAQYGRVMYNEYHVENVSEGTKPLFPAECPTLAGEDEVAQEKMLEYALFDLSNSVTPVVVPSVTITLGNSPSTFEEGDSADTVTVDVANGSTALSATTNLPVTLTIALPAGLTATAITETDGTGGWTCTLGSLSCTQTTGIAANASYAFSVTVSVSPTATGGNASASGSVSATVSSNTFSRSSSNTLSITTDEHAAVSWATPAVIAYGTALSATQLNAIGNANGNVTANAVGTYVYSPVSGTTLDAGSQTLSVTYTPSVSYQGAYPGTGTASVTLQINQATSTISVANTSGNSTSNQGDPVTFTATVSSGASGTVTFYENGTSIGSGTISGTTATLTTSALSAGSLNITAYWPGNTDYSSATSSGITQVVNAVTAAAATAPAATNFGSEPVASTTSPVAVTFTITSAGTIGTPVVLTQGATGLDFVNSGGGTCTAGAASGSCTVNVTFTPKYPGMRVGAVLLEDGSGGVLATAYIYGTGTGPQVTFASTTAGYNAPSAVSTLGGGFHNPFGVATDQSGNVFVVDQGNAAVKKIPAGCGSSSCVTTLGGTYGYPYYVAIDGGGNLYVTDGNNHVIEISAASGYTTTTNTLGGGPYQPVGVAVDGSGNVYIDDFNTGTGYWQVQKIPAGCNASACVTTLAGGYGALYGMAVDASGDVFFAEMYAGLVHEIPVECASASCVVTVGSGLIYPAGLAVDGLGNLFVSDYGGTNVYEFTVASVYTVKYQLNPEYAYNGPAGVAVDGLGNVIVVDSTATSLQKLDFADPPSLSFLAPTTVNTIDSTDGPLSVTVENVGNAALTFSSTGLSAPTDFIQTAGSGSPADCASSGTVAAGSSCNLSIKFSPTQAGSPLNELFGLTDNNLNGSAVVQNIPLSGTASQGTPTISISNVPSGAVYGGSFTPSLSYTGNGTTSVASNTLSICTVSGGVVNFIAAGTCSLTPSATATSSYTAVTGSAQTFAVGQATPTISISNLPSSAAYGGSFTPALNYTGNGTTSVASNSLSICTVSGGVVNFISAGTCSLTPSATATTNYAAIPGTAQTFSVGQATASATLGNLTQTYTGAPLAATAITTPAGLPVTFLYTGTNGTTYGPSSTPPTNPGSYAVVATISNADYTGTASGTLVIAAPLNLNLNLSVSGLAFGSVPVGFSSPTLTVILTNPNNSPMTISSIVASGDFTASSNCPTIAIGATCSVNVTFAPTATGARTGTLTISDAESNTPQTIPLTGTGTEAGIQITPVLVNFGSQVVATTSMGQTLTILNTGTADLVISNIATSGDFATAGSCALVPAGSNCNLTVTFTPTTTGALVGTITLTDNVGGGSQSQVVNLTGRGTVAGAALAPSELSFSGTVVGSTSFVLSTTLTNTGTAALTGIGVSAVGDFTATNCASSLVPAATCTINVQYAPTVAGAETGTLLVTDNLGTQSVALTGTGLLPGASLSTAQLVFGGQLVGTSSQAQTILFTNTGTSPVSIASVTATTDFNDTTNCTGSIAAGASCSVNIFFAPTAAGSHNGTVTVIDGVGTQITTLQGQGVAPGLAVTPSFAIFGTQVVGTTSQAQTLTVANTGTTTLTLNPITVSSNFAESDQCSSPLAPGATCSVSLSFTPVSTGALAGSLVVTDTTGAVSSLVTLSGQGTLPGISASPSTLFFGSLPVGITSQAQTITVTNSGTAPLQIGTVSGSGDFAETNNCATQTIQPANYCVISVTMTPTTAGTRTGTIQFSDNADGLHLIALSGMGQQAGVAVSPTNLAFGSLPIVSSTQAASTAGTSLTVTITNTGNAALTLSGFATTGDFSELNSCGSTVAAGAACTLTVSFVPTALGHRTGTLTITDSAGGGTQSVSLEGDGSTGGLTLSPPVINFGVQTVGETSHSSAATLTNNTGAAIDDLVIMPSGEYGATNNCGSSLANAASCTLEITVTPATQGSITGTINVTGTLGANNGARQAAVHSEATGGSGGSSLGVVALTASAIPPGIGLSIPELSFSVTAVGTPSTGQVLTLTNTGTAASLTGLAISGTDTAEFPFTTTCTATLAMQASCTITINFTPVQLGLRTGTLNITANGGISAAVPESGSALADFAVSSVNAASGGASQTILPGGTANYTIAITPNIGTSFSSPAVLSVSGQPAGSVPSLTTAPWTQLTATSWQLPANTTLNNLGLSFAVPAQSASARPDRTLQRTLPPVLWGLLLLPFAVRLRRAGRRLARSLSLLLLVAAGAAALATLSGCGSGNGFFGQPQQSYTITVSVTNGTNTHSTNLNLTVQ